MQPETATQQSVFNKSSEDKFLIVLTLPPIMKSIDTPKRNGVSVDLDTLQFSVEGSIIPTSTISNVTIPFAGQNLEVTSYARSPWQKNRVRFTVDNRFNNYWILWKWLNILNDSKLSLYNVDNTPDEEKSVAEWVNYIEYHLTKAKDKVYHLRTDDALAELRKAGAHLGLRGLPDGEDITIAEWLLAATHAWDSE